MMRVRVPPRSAHGYVAQLVEHPVEAREVSGSNPDVATASCLYGIPGSPTLDGAGDSAVLAADGFLGHAASTRHGQGR